MVKPFMDDNFLLPNETAEELYHRHASHMPIIDYHCHLNPQEIYEDKRFANLSEAWLYGDHYKWRAMRANGVEERYVTGGPGASDYDRFVRWAETVPQAIGNPLYHWTHLELQRCFGIHTLLSGQTAGSIWEQAEEAFASGGITARSLIAKFNVETICTTDDPADSLEYHRLIRELPDFATKVLPSFRPDKGLEIRRATFLPWIRRLEEAAGTSITAYSDLLEALKRRVDFFHDTGCRVSDHALDAVMWTEAPEREADAIFRKALDGRSLTLEEEAKYKTVTLLHLGRLYAGRGWVMQLHINASRNNSTRRFEALGPDIGGDSIGDSPLAGPLVRLLDALDYDGALPKTILYSLNGGQNDVLASIAGSFQEGGTPGKMQLGSAWWFNDTKIGMRAQLQSLANIGLLGRFVGMLTDSRSFLSYPRHEYFRRILCGLLGEWVENGEAPRDMELLGGLVRNISYGNAKTYFPF